MNFWGFEDIVERQKKGEWELYPSGHNKVIYYLVDGRHIVLTPTGWTVMYRGFSC